MLNLFFKDGFLDHLLDRTLILSVYAGNYIVKCSVFLRSETEKTGITTDIYARICFPPSPKQFYMDTNKSCTYLY